MAHTLHSSAVSIICITSNLKLWMKFGENTEACLIELAAKPDQMEDKTIESSDWPSAGKFGSEMKTVCRLVAICLHL